MKPFLFLGTRPEDDVAESEYVAVLRCAGLDERDVRRVRLERDELGHVDLDDWSGIVLGGGPFNISDPADSKSAVQHRVEAELRGLALLVVEADFPFFGACYGIGTLGSLRGGVVDRTHGEPIGAVEVTKTEAGGLDPLLGPLPDAFEVFLGHKEAVSRLPDGAVLLASSATCPVQAFRIGERVYATQFHPELGRRRALPAHRRVPPPRLLRPVPGRGADGPGAHRRGHRAAAAAGPVRGALRALRRVVLPCARHGRRGRLCLWTVAGGSPGPRSPWARSSCSSTYCCPPWSCSSWRRSPWPYAGSGPPRSGWSARHTRPGWPSRCSAGRWPGRCSSWPWSSPSPST
ncbi:glutamine amidotransferase [Nocardioides ungokensis]|uniref:glutamine amidotransferase n=1 Tax=Nocardioides ungokensis TaxID=1643322 RepID=UPI001C60D07B|nr:glutamine amidotransferase [Nocardioides ungokensis]